jgi:hypothetical protein
VTFRMTTCLLVCQVEKLLADRKAGHRVRQVSHLLPTGTQVLQTLLAPPLKRRLLALFLASMKRLYLLLISRQNKFRIGDSG